MIALDSNVFIYHLEANPEFGTHAEELLKAVESGRPIAVTSELTFTEVLGFSGMTDEQAIIAQREIVKSGVKFIKATTDIVLLAASLRRQYKLRTPDAIHVASALAAGATHFITNDRTLLKSTIVGIEVVNLTSAKETMLPPAP